MKSITTILSTYAREEPRRALGGIYALAGFDYQLRFYLAEFAKSLTGEGQALDKAGEVFLEALSDLSKKADEHLVCIQVKRTLTRETLKHAAAEVKAIDNFLQKTYPDWRSKVKFELVAAQGDANLDWSDIPATHPTHTTIEALRQQGRLLPPRIEPDPWWQAVVAVWKHLKDPYAFLRFALDRTLSRAPDAADASRIRDDICERFKQDRQANDLPGQLLTTADFQRRENPGPTLEIGREITLARLRDQQYMPRAHRLDALYANLLERKDLSQRDLKSEARVFWLSGRSGVGKSVLLLQTVERLVTEGWRVLWLKGQAELLEPALRAVTSAPLDWQPDFIAIDDLYDRDARNQLQLDHLGKFIDEQGQRAWPMILTCGPAEFADAFKEDSAYNGFDLHCETVHTIAADEAAEIETWYCERTHRPSRRGPAFSQAGQEDGGLFVSLAVELAHGDLQAFAQRFGERVRLNEDLDKALYLPLALNRLYLRAPYDWLSESDREKLATLNTEGDFSLLDADTEEQIVRLTHPHLADALYRALRKPANALAYTNDLVAAFQRAFAERQWSLVLQLLRVFSTRDDGLTSERLNILDRTSLANQCAKIWADTQAQLALDDDARADAMSSWACWATTAPGIAKVLGADLLGRALVSLVPAHKSWSVCWNRLAACHPRRDELFAWAATQLTDPQKIKHPTWSLVWEHCLQHDPGRHGAWRDMGLGWLQNHFRRPDWHFVWKKLLPVSKALDWHADPALIQGRRRLTAATDGPDWAYVFEDLYALASPRSQQANELATLAHTWLAGREDRAEWSHVWRTLLASGDALPAGVTRADLLGLGAAWLAGREDRAEWNYVWQTLLAASDALPAGITRADLLGMGAAWLAGREDRAEWAHVWQDLLAAGDALPAGVARIDLLGMGAAWLAGREDRAEWNYVWQTLLAAGDALPAGLTRADLLGMGAAWLAGREDRAEWNYVWQTLLAVGDALPAGVTRIDLLGMGAAWLAGREDRAEWNYVWQTLLAAGDALPTGFLRADLLGMGAAWLAGREDRADWSHVWQTLLAAGDDLPPGVSHSDLLGMGAAWLAGREDRADWAHVWRNLLAAGDALPAGVTHADLLGMGAAWLAGRGNTEEWGFVCETLLDQHFQAKSFIDQAADWLRRTADKPEWPLLAAKLIVAAPRHAASADFAQTLTQRIKACPNSGHWFKTEQLLCKLTADKELSPAVRDWLQTLQTRGEAPAWAEARRHLEQELQMKGQVVAVMSGFCSVELEIGLMALWSDSRDGVRRSKGMVYSFYVLTLNPDKGRVVVGLEKPVALKVDKFYEGIVIKTQSYGLKIKLGRNTGLLHHSQCPNWTGIALKYPEGSSIRVEILALTDKGPQLRYAGPEIEGACIEAAPIIGDVREATVTGLQTYGAFLRSGPYVGLLHRNRLPAGIDIPTHFTLGQSLGVRVIEIRDDGKLVFTLPD